MYKVPLSVQRQICAFLDIEGAVDNTSHVGVDRSFEKHNVQRNIRRWVAVNAVTEVKYLGGFLHSELLWRTHVEATTFKATLMVCKCLAGKSWGCTPRIPSRRFIMTVPIVTYRAVAWVSSTTLVTVRQLLTSSHVCHV